LSLELNDETIFQQNSVFRALEKREWKYFGNSKPLEIFLVLEITRTKAPPGPRDARDVKLFSLFMRLLSISSSPWRWGERGEHAYMPSQAEKETQNVRFLIIALYSNCALSERGHGAQTPLIFARVWAGRQDVACNTENKTVFRSSSQHFLP
jgi:hypothetical protein